MSLIIWIRILPSHFEYRHIGESAKIQFQGHNKGTQEEFCDIVSSICLKSMSQQFNVAKCTNDTSCRCIFQNHGIPEWSSQWLGRATYVNLMHSRSLSGSTSFIALHVMLIKSKFCQNVASSQPRSIKLPIVSISTQCQMTKASMPSLSCRRQF